MSMSYATIISFAVALLVGCSRHEDEKRTANEPENVLLTPGAPLLSDEDKVLNSASKYVIENSLGILEGSAEPAAISITGYVTDRASALSVVEAKTVEEKLKKLTLVDYQARVLLIETTGPFSIHEYAKKLANRAAWSGAAIDMLIVVATKDRRVQIVYRETGRMSDEASDFLIKEVFTPAAKIQNIGTALGALVDRIPEVLKSKS